MLILKTFKNDEEWCFSFWNTIFRFRDIQVFVQKLMMSQTVHMTVINHKIENISENIGWVSFKLGSDYLGQVMQINNNTLYAVTVTTFLTQD